jgi:hypothetical protein
MVNMVKGNARAAFAGACCAAVVLCGDVSGMITEETGSDEPVLSFSLTIDPCRDDTGVGKGQLFQHFERLEDGNKQPCYCWTKTREKATLEEAIALIPRYKKLLPNTEESFTEYYSKYREYYLKYKGGAEDRLIDTGYFHPWNRVKIEVDFCCFEGKFPARAIENVDAFSKLLVKSEDKNFIICMRHLGLNSALDVWIVGEAADRYGLSRELFQYTAVLEERRKYDELWTQRLVEL